jgi:hypothetical protein
VIRRASALLVTAAVATATLAVASPAKAQGPLDCLDIQFEFPQANSVTVDVDTLQVRVDPDAIEGDVTMLAGLVAGITLDLARCLEGGLIVGPAMCYVDRALEIANSLDPLSLQLRYVYQDPETGDFVIDGGRLLADLTSC